MSKRQDSPDWRGWCARNVMLVTVLVGLLIGSASIALLVVLAYLLPLWAYLGLYALSAAWVGHRLDLRRRTA